MAYKEANPSDVRAHNRAANGACDEYKQLKVLSMGRQKAVIKARREAKRVLRRDSRSHKQREEESVTSLVQMSGVEAIGMARDSRDTSPILARNEAQLHYLKAIESKQLIFATGEAGCGKTWISAAKAAEALIHKDVDRIIVTRPVLQADEILASYLEISQKSLLLFSSGLRRAGPALRGFLYAVLPATGNREGGNCAVRLYAWTYL